MAKILKIGDRREVLDDVTVYYPLTECRTRVFRKDGTSAEYEVPVQAIDKLMEDDEPKWAHELTAQLRRLSEALDRLGVRIPTSIRMHL